MAEFRDWDWITCIAFAVTSTQLLNNIRQHYQEINSSFSQSMSHLSDICCQRTNYSSFSQRPEDYQKSCSEDLSLFSQESNLQDEKCGLRLTKRTQKKKKTRTKRAYHPCLATSECSRWLHSPHPSSTKDINLPLFFPIALVDTLLECYHAMLTKPKYLRSHTYMTQITGTSTMGDKTVIE